MKSDLSKHEETDDHLSSGACADLMRSPFDLAPVVPGTEVALALAAELAPYFNLDER